MTRRLAPLVLILAVGGLSACSVVSGWRASQPPAPHPPAPVDSSSWKAPPKGYLAAGVAVDAMAVMPPPPAVGSPQNLAEVATFNATRALQGTPRWTQALRDADLSGKEAFHSFSCAAGVKIGPDTTPTLSRLMLRMTDDAHPVTGAAKDLYDRRRPAAGNTAPICVPRESWIETNGSYPSTHALIGYGWSLILAELLPEKTTALITRGRDFGDSRVICGLHWQSDVEAGRMLGGALVARLHAEPEFQSDLAAARAEIEAARKLGAPAHCPAS